MAFLTPNQQHEHKTQLATTGKLLNNGDWNEMARQLWRMDLREEFGGAVDTIVWHMLFAKDLPHDIRVMYNDTQRGTILVPDDIKNHLSDTMELYFKNKLNKTNK